MSDSRIVRGTVRVSHGDNKLRDVQLELEGGEVRDEIENLEQYGFTSEPFCDGGTDALAVFLDDSSQLGFALNIADRRYRITSMKPGEVAIYDDKGRHIYFKRDCIEVEGKDDPINVQTAGPVTIKAASVTIDAPTTTFTGKVVVTSTVTAAGDVTGKGVSLASHTHPGDSGGSTGTPR